MSRGVILDCFKGDVELKEWACIELDHHKKMRQAAFNFPLF